MNRTLLILIILTCLPVVSGAVEQPDTLLRSGNTLYYEGDLSGTMQNPDSLFRSGSMLYNMGDYSGALEMWQDIVDSGVYSPALYYNMGNSAFKSGQIAYSILWYEKALLMKPFHEDIRYNLEIARSYVTDRFDVVPELFVVRWFRMVSLIFDSNGWVILSITLFTLCLSLLLWWLFSRDRSVKRKTLAIAILSLTFSLLSLGLYYGNRAVTVKKRAAVILSSAETGMSSPRTGGKELFVIHEGTKVRIEEEAGEWLRIRLPDGNVGWIISNGVAKI